MTGDLGQALETLKSAIWIRYKGCLIEKSNDGFIVWGNWYSSRSLAEKSIDNTFLKVGNSIKKQVMDDDQYIFTTEDNIRIKIGDQYWYVRKDRKVFMDTADSHTGGRVVAHGLERIGDKFFGIRENAHHYAKTGEGLSKQEIKKSPPNRQG